QGISSNHLKISALEASYYMRNQLLRDTDWASMAHSVEVRVPLVDWRLWETTARLIRSAPSLNKRSMARSPILPPPSELMSRAKTGFQIPTRTWIGDRATRHGQRGLRGWAHYVYEA